MKKNKYFSVFLLLVLILAGCSNSEEVKSREIAIAFGMDLYTIDTQEVDKYKSILNLNIYNAKVLYEALQINDDVLKSLMTDDAYDTLLRNRENLMFTQACYKGNYTMQVTEFKLSENKNDIEDNEAGYNFEAQIKIISNDGTENTDIAKGLIELDKVDGNWKVTGYRNIVPDFIIDTLNKKKINED